MFSSPKNKRESTVSSDNPWVHVKGSMVAEAEGEKRKLTKSSSPRSEAVAKSTRIRMCTTSSNPISGAADKPTDSSSSDSISLRSKGSVIHTEFPALLHRFIDECAVTHPDIVEWNNTFTGFNVEIHHPQLPNLLLKYFRRTFCLALVLNGLWSNPARPLTLHSIPVMTDGNYSSLRRQLNSYGFRRDL